MRPVPRTILRYAQLRERLPRGPIVMDLASSYALSVARVGAAAGVIGLLYRFAGAEAVAAFVLTRSVLSLMVYAYAGFNPAVQTALTKAREATAIGRSRVALPAAIGAAATLWTDGQQTLEYVHAAPDQAQTATTGDRLIFRSANLAIAIVSIAIVLALVVVRDAAIDNVGLNGYRLKAFVTTFCIGMLVRLLGETCGGVAQTRGKLRLDNVIQTVGEGAWLMLVAASLASDRSRSIDRLGVVGQAYLMTGLFVLLGRWWVAARSITEAGRESRRFHGGVVAAILACALTISLGSLADFLYGPSNVLIINRLLSPTLVADYGPALQIDGALLLTVSAVAVVLLPRVVEASRHHDLAAVRQLYVRASVTSFAILVVGAIVIVAGRDLILRHWLGTVPAATRMILPLVLVHTVIGGTAGVGRATLLGLGRFRAYTISALIGGAMNVSLALLFVWLGLGLRGIAFATIIAVAIRCAAWMPWYILRATRLVPSPPYPGERARVRG